MMQTSYVQQLRNEIKESLKTKKTLNDLELFDYIEAKVQSDDKITKSKIIKKLREEGYSISQSRVFDLFSRLHQAMKNDQMETIKQKVSEEEKEKLDKAEQEKLALQKKIAELEKQLKAKTTRTTRTAKK
jgi:hypothetical protein